MNVPSLLRQRLTYILALAISYFSVTVWAQSPNTSDSPYWHNSRAIAQPRPGLTLLNIKGFQQTTDYTCGPSAALTLVRYFGKTGDELRIAKDMGTSDKTGTSPEQMATWLRKQGFNVSWGEHGSLQMLRENLAKGIPVLVEWSDWGGHWSLVIGYDTRDTALPDDDVIIFADPADSHDDAQDGITWFNALRFESLWFDALLFGKVMEKIYIVAMPNNSNPAPAP